MLEFIVLGQVPGTQIQLNFTGVLLIAAVLVFVAKTSVKYYRYHKLREQFEQLALYMNIITKKRSSRKRA